MKKAILTGSLIVSAALLSACGGGSSSSGDDADGGESGPYNASSYTNTETSAANLSGTWMYLENSDVERVYFSSPILSNRITGTTRSAISIIDNGNDTVTLVNCLQDVMNQQTVPVGSGLISFSRGAYDIAGEVINNRRIEAELLSTGDNTHVYSSAVTLVKIADELAFNNDGRLGSFDVSLKNYQNENNTGTLNDLPIHCFKQAHYEIEETDDDVVSSDIRSTVYFASFDENLQVPSGSTLGEDWMDSHFVELYVSDDPGKDDANIQFWPEHTSSLTSFGQTGNIEISILESTVTALSGSAKNTGYEQGDDYLQDIEIDFQIGL